MSPGTGSRGPGEGYDLAEHRHRFGLWAAAQAAHRAFRAARHARLDEALAASGVVEVVRGPAAERPSTAEAFDQLHGTWCARLARALADQGIGTTYGRAAQLLATYLKATVVLGEDAFSGFGRVVHPPVDAPLLKGLATALEPHFRRHQVHWRALRWARLDREAYVGLVGTLREAARDVGLPALWMLERYRVDEVP